MLMQQGPCLITFPVLARTSVTSLKAGWAWVTEPLCLFAHEPLEVMIAERACRNQSRPWPAPSDNVVEMEMSCSNVDEDEFAGVIGSATLRHGRRESGCQRLREQLKCLLSAPPPNLYSLLDRQVHAHSSQLSGIAWKEYFRMREGGNLYFIWSFFFFFTPFPCMKSDGSHGNLALYRT